MRNPYADEAVASKCERKPWKSKRNKCILKPPRSQSARRREEENTITLYLSLRARFAGLSVGIGSVEFGDVAFDVVGLNVVWGTATFCVVAFGDSADVGMLCVVAFATVAFDVDGSGGAVGDAFDVVACCVVVCGAAVFDVVACCVVVCGAAVVVAACGDVVLCVAVIGIEAVAF